MQQKEAAFGAPALAAREEPLRIGTHAALFEVVLFKLDQDVFGLKRRPPMRDSWQAAVASDGC